MKRIIIVTIFLIFLSVFVLYFLNKNKSNPINQNQTTVTPEIVGGDRDANGCIGSAGYSWCDSKQKCLRPWEEPCDEISPTTIIDETEVIKTEIKQALINKHGQNADKLTVTVSKIIDNYSSGGASVVSEGGGMWFAAKENNHWNLVWDGNGIILCQDLVSYPDFPSSMIPECYDQKTNKLIKR